MRTFFSTSIAVVAPLLGALAIGCGVPAETDEDADETSSSVTKVAIAEGSHDADVVLRFVNAASRADLEAVRPRITRSAIDNILAHRAGADAELGTVDDQELATIAALDAIPRVGPATIANLLAAAKAAGYVVDEFSPSWCEGPALTATEASAMLSTGSRYWNSFAVGFARARGRWSGGEWQELQPSDPALQSPFGYVTAPELADAHVKLFSSTAPLFQMEQRGFRREWCASGYPRSCYMPKLDFKATLDLTTGVTEAHLGYPPPTNDPSMRSVDHPESALYGNTTIRVTKSCYQLVAKYMQPYTGREIEVTVGGRFPW